MTNLLKHLLLFVLLSSFASTLHGQQTLQVVTKTIEKTFPFKKGTILNIEGEKAELDIITGNTDIIKIKMNLIAKHPDKRTAVADLQNMKHIAQSMGKKVFIRNYIALEKGETKPLSNLKAVYTIIVPKDCPINLSNYFGSVNINGLSNQLDMDTEFCKLNIQNVKGDVNVKTRFGDLDARLVSGNVKIQSRRSNVLLRELKGSFDLNTRYGEVKVYADKSLIDLNINSEKSNIRFLNPPDNSYNYALSAKYGEISVPSTLDFDFADGEEEGTKTASYEEAMGQANVSINASFGDIFIGSE